MTCIHSLCGFDGKAFCGPGGKIDVIVNGSLDYSWDRALGITVVKMPNFTLDLGCQYQ